MQQHGHEDASDPWEKPWTSGFYKSAVDGPIFVGRTNILGDQQADLVNHGGVDKAVLAYSAEHYPLWRQELSKPDLSFGAFGENLTITGLDEQAVCIGDVWSLGKVLLQVSQPRQPCWKLARRWRIKELTALVVRNGRCGWYLRVLREGTIESGMPWELVERPHPQWSIAAANAVLYQHADHGSSIGLASLPELSVAWKKSLLNG